MLDLLLSLDRALFVFFNAVISNPVFDVVFPYITKSRHWVIPGIVGAVVFIFFKKKQALIILGLAIITVALSDPISVRILKPLFGRLRPCHPSYFQDGVHMFLQGCHFFFGHKTSLSMPSAHATNIFAQAMLLTLFFPKQVWYFFVFAAAIGFSRVYVGVHYPFDVFVGALVGMAIGASVYLLYNYIRQWVRLRKTSS